LKNGGGYSSGGPNMSNENAEEIFRQFFGNGKGSGPKFSFANFSNFHNTSSDEEDPFSNMFSTRKKKFSDKSTLKKSEPVVHTVTCSLEDLFNQKTKKIKITRKIQNEEKNYTEEKVLTFDLRPGCKEGTKITFEKEGDQAYGYEPQDIIFQLTFKKT